MSTLTLTPLLRAAIGYAHLVGGIPVADLLAGMKDGWRQMRRDALAGPRDSIVILCDALDLCAFTMRYNSPDEFEGALGTLLRAAGRMPLAPEGKEWRRASASEEWHLRTRFGRTQEVPDVWSAFAWEGAIIVPAVLGVTFQSAPAAIWAGATVRRRCLEGHGSPEGGAFADSIDALTASVVAP